MVKNTKFVKLKSRLKDLNNRQLTSVCCLKIKDQLYPDSKKFLSTENRKSLDIVEKNLNDGWKVLR